MMLTLRIEDGVRVVAEHTLPRDTGSVFVGGHATDERFRYGLGSVHECLELFRQEGSVWYLLKLSSYSVFFETGSPIEWRPVSGAFGEHGALRAPVRGVIEFRFETKKGDVVTPRIVRIYFEVR